ncbi:MAG: FHA domain-containing protein [Vicinamibacteria bacterium]
MRFEIRHPSHREEISADSDFVVFGRDPSCDVVIKNPRCSRRHASIRIVPGGFHLLDIGSSNGVYVLGQKVDDAIIREGDVFSVGDVFVRVLPEDMASTLAMANEDATMRQSSPPIEPARRPLPSSISQSDLAMRIMIARSPRMASRALAGSSIAVGSALIVTSLGLGTALGASAAYLLPILGGVSILAGVGVLWRFWWARTLHYFIFTLWALTCLLAPFAVIGFAYQLRGEDHPDTDSFFAVVIGLAGAMAVIALVVAASLARIYIPAPLPL